MSWREWHGDVALRDEVWLCEIIRRREGIMRVSRLVPLRLAVTLTGLSALVACDDVFGPRACTLEMRPSVVVYVRDARTDAYIAAGATLILADGAFVDSVTVPADRSSENARGLWTFESSERPGVYQVTVRREGYEEWVRSGVWVRGDACHVATVTTTARMVAAP